MFSNLVFLLTFHSGQEEEMMRMLVSWGPLAVTVDAISWQDYLGGIIQYHCSSGRANHAVLITGFDRTGAFPPAELQHCRFCIFSFTCTLPFVGQVIKTQSSVVGICLL